MSADVSASRDPEAHHIPTIFAGLMLGMLIAALSQTIVAPALPRIVAELGGLEHYSWVAVSALLAAAVTVPRMRAGGPPAARPLIRPPRDIPSGACSS